MLAISVAALHVAAVIVVIVAPTDVTTRSNKEAQKLSGPDDEHLRAPRRNRYDRSECTPSGIAAAESIERFTQTNGRPARMPGCQNAQAMSWVTLYRRCFCRL